MLFRSRNYVNGKLVFDSNPVEITGNVFISGVLSASSVIGGGGGSTTPGGANTYVQYNNVGAFAGSTNFVWNNAASTLQITGDLSASVNISGSSFYGDGSNLTNIPAGSPAGLNTEIQFNADGVFGSDTGLTWASASNALTVNGPLIVTGSTSELQVPEIQVDINHIATGHSTGRMYWDSEDKTMALDMQGSDVRLQIGQEQHLYGKNMSGVTINNGDVVRIAGAAGANILLEKAISSISPLDGGVEQDEILGMATEQILDNQKGYITTYGQVRDVNTLGFTTGDLLFLSHTVSGSYTNTKPPAPYFPARVGIVEVVNATTGVVLCRPSEPIHLSDIANITSSNVPVGVPSYMCYDDTTSIVSFTNAISGTFSGSFQGDGSNLTNIAIPSGTIGRIDTTGLETFYSSISGAVAASVAGDYVRVGPGTYIEDTPINIPAGISVTGDAGWQVTNVSSSTGLGNTFVLSAGSLLRDIKIAIPADTGSYAATFSGSAGQVASANFLSFYGGTGLRGSGYGQVGPGKTIGLELRYSTGDCDAFLEVTDGILATEGVHIPNSAGAIDAGIRANSPSATRVGNRGRFQGIDINMGATNVEDGIVAGSTSTVVLQGINLFNIQNTFHLTSNSASLLVTSGLSDPVVNDIKLDAGLTGDGSLTRINAFMNGVFDIPYTWIPSDHAWTFFTSKTDTSEASSNLFGARQVIGHPEFGSGFSAGEGDSYSTKNSVLTTDGTTDSPTNNGTGFVDESVAASSLTGSTFSFQGTTVGHSILWCTKRVDSSNTTLKHWGLEIDQVLAAVTGAGNFIFEYQSAPNVWIEIGSMAVSAEEQYRYGNNIFLRGNSEEHIFAGITAAVSWAPTTINSVTGHWMRCRIEASITTAPTFERFRLMPSVSSINNRGNRLAKGLAMWTKSIEVSQVKWQGAGLANATIDVGDGGPSWSQNLEKGLLNGSGDKAEAFLIIPQSVCTAHYLKIKIYYGFQNTSGATTLGMSIVPAQTALNLVADPAGGVVPIPRVFATTELTTTNAPFIPTSVVSPIPTTAKAHVVLAEFINIDISDYYAGDLIFLQLDVAASFGSQLQLLAMSIEGIAFAEEVIE